MIDLTISNVVCFLPTSWLRMNMRRRNLRLFKTLANRRASSLLSRVTEDEQLSSLTTADRDPQVRLALMTKEGHHRTIATSIASL